MLIIYVGDVGAGKSFCALKYALTCNRGFWDNLERSVYKTQEQFPTIFANTFFKPIYETKMRRWKEPKEFAHMTCGVVYVDECDMYFNSRKFQNLSDEAREFIKERRKHHCRMVMTTQNVSFVDKVFRTLASQVRIVRRLSLPFVGHIWPWSVRADVVCKFCKKVRLDDGIGDQSTRFRRWLGFGTVFFWTAWSPDVLGETESTKAEEIEAQDERRAQPKVLGRGMHLFDSRVAALYDTSSRISQEVQANRKSALAHQHA